MLSKEKFNIIINFKQNEKKVLIKKGFFRK